MNANDSNCVRDCADINLINQHKQRLNSITNKMSSAALTLSLIGNETRFKVLFLINLKQDICVCDMSDILGFSVSAISQQLKKLKKANLLSSEKRSQTIYYHINPPSQSLIDNIFNLFSISCESKTK